MVVYHCCIFAPHQKLVAKTWLDFRVSYCKKCGLIKTRGTRKNKKQQRVDLARSLSSFCLSALKRFQSLMILHFLTHIDPSKSAPKITSGLSQSLFKAASKFLPFQNGRDSSQSPFKATFWQRQKCYFLPVTPNVNLEQIRNRSCAKRIGKVLLGIR